MKTILRFIASSLFLALMVVVGNVTISYAEDTNTNTTTEVEETATTQQASAEQTSTLTNAEVKNGWSYDDTKGHYLYYQNNKLFTGWITENEWQEKGNYFVDNGEKAENTFKTIGNDRYHFDYNGKVSTGLFTVWDDSKNISVTYFADTNGKLFKEGLKTVGNNKYYFENYIAVTDERKLINGKYYFFKYDGTLLTGEWYGDINGQEKRVLADSNGVLVNGWRAYTINDNVKKWNYYENGFAVTEGTRNIDGSTYTFDSNGLVRGSAVIKDKNTGEDIYEQTSRTGSLLTGLQLVDGEYYYYNKDHSLVETGWLKTNGYWYYFEDSTAVTNNWKEIKGKKYYFDTDGKMRVGWIKHNANSYWNYADASGALITGKFTTINGVKYAFDNNGDWCADGVFYIGDKFYGFDKNGKLRTGWYLDENGDWHYLNKQGIALTKWQELNGKWYYFDEYTSIMYWGSEELPNNKIYLFDVNGAWVKITKQGWLEVDGYWFYIDKNLQPLVGEHVIDGHIYYFSTGDKGVGIGTMYADEVFETMDDNYDVTSRTYYDKNGFGINKISAGWHLFGGEWYYYDGDNKPHNGLLQYKGNTYFIDNGKMVYDVSEEIDEDNHIAYFFDKNGKKVMSGWCQPEDSKSWYYADKSKNGQLVTGLNTINGKLYYFETYCVYPETFIYIDRDNNNYDMYASDKNSAIIINGWFTTERNWFYFGKDGKVYKDKWLNYKGKWYYFDWNGRMVTGYRNIYNPKIYEFIPYKFDENGALLIGWEKIDNKWYYFDSNSDYARGWKKIGKTWYYFNDTGKMMTGWQLIDGTYYYFENSGAMAANKWVGNYYLQANGSMAKNTWIGKYHVDANGKWDKTR